MIWQTDRFYKIDKARSQSYAHFQKNKCASLRISVSPDIKPFMSYHIISIMWLFLFIALAAPISEFACGAFRPFPLCICALCSRLNVREHPRA